MTVALSPPPNRSFHRRRVDVAAPGFDAALAVTRSRKVAAWLDFRMVPIAAAALLLTNVALGITLTVIPESEFRSAVYTQAKSVMDLDTWGAILLVLTTVTAIGWWMHGRCRFVGFMLAALIGWAFWGFWAVLATLSSFGINGASGFLPILTWTLATLHVICGLAWPITRRLPLPRS